MIKTLKIKSPAKVNLFLEVLGKRPDGFHEIATVIQEVNLFDHLEIREKKTGIHIKTDFPGLPAGKDNLVYRAIELFKRRYKIRQGVEITIRKRIPLGAGLGGGSSNAAYTLRGLNKLWRLNLSQTELSLLARKLGSDVTFFIYGNTALCKGRGEIVFPLSFPYSGYYLIIYPGFHIPTKKIYRNLNLGLTKPVQDVNIFVTNLRRNGIKGLFNRLEKTVFRVYPQMQGLKTRLLNLGLSEAMVAGSGSSIFGLVKDRKEGGGLLRKIRDQKIGKVFLVKGSKGF